MRDIMRGFNAESKRALTHDCAIIVASNILERASRIRSDVDTTSTLATVMYGPLVHAPRDLLWRVIAASGS